MIVTIRLYWQHDLDLIALSQQDNFNIGEELKNAVTAYVRGLPYAVSVPKVISPKRDKQGNVIPIENTSTFFTLSQKYDTDIMDFLSSLKPGYKNNAIKVIFRAYLNTPNLSPYLADSEFVLKTKVTDKATYAKKPKKAKKKEAPVMQGKIIARAEQVDKAIAAAGYDTELKGVPEEPVSTYEAEPVVIKAPIQEAPVQETPVITEEKPKESTVQAENTPVKEESKQPEQKPDEPDDSGFNLFSAIGNMF